MTMRTGSLPDKGLLPRWARIAVAVYLAVTVAAVGASLVTGSFETGLDAVFRERLWLAVVVLTLPVSAAYFAVVFLLDSSGPPPQGGLRPTTVIHYLGFLALAVVNAALFRWMVLSIRKPVPAARPLAMPQVPGVTIHGVTRNVRNLWWTVPLAVLLSFPQWLVAGLAWCGISGCSGGGFGVSTGTEWLAVTMSVVNGLILAVAVFAVRWLYPTRRRALIALAAGTLFGLLGAAVTHG
ncbi:hypothetical protein NG697_01220 [Pseudarthrobacter sp. MDT3-26]|uniref:hypothetical protein n=1 Tax=Pseudarthrobacter raffinosi TaxID=2953651 RepID=UPI00208EFC41|nr:MULTISPECIES: hypothetical protein [unclassified Pseudarthrobacter]MCO4236962.1 hypothetical protein [Pseudarthrobacter sp. MDT3-28]MCO4261569.1 hypothetical protein [Pseudarthrobacter sp. MDT3-26]